MQNQTSYKKTKLKLDKKIKCGHIASENSVHKLSFSQHVVEFLTSWKTRKQRPDWDIIFWHSYRINLLRKTARETIKAKKALFFGNNKHLRANPKQ